MRTGLRLLTPPTTSPVSLAEAKLHCRIDHTDEDDLVQGLINTATEYCEGLQRRSYITQTWQLTMDDWPLGRVLELPRPPLQSVTSVQYLLEDGVTTETLDSDLYVVDTSTILGRLVLKPDAEWPDDALNAAGAITIEYIAGYGDTPADVPASVRQSIQLLVGHWYAHREAVVVGAAAMTVPVAVEALLWPDRVVVI